jgi:hypothetical protein
MEQIEAPKPPPPPPAVAASIRSFTTDPQGPVHPGDQVTLKWETENASSVTLDPLGRVDLSGHQTVTAQLNAGYVLTATGSDGKTVRQSLALNVVPVTITEKPKPSGPDQAELLKAVRGYQAVFEQASGNKNSRDCAGVFNSPYGGALKYLAKWCGIAQKFHADEKCGAVPSGSAESPSLSCDEVVTIYPKAGDPSATRANKTFHFAKDQKGEWQISGWN